MPSLTQHQSNQYTAEDIAAHFNRPIIINEHGCWLWFGATDINGYARFRSRLVHKLVWDMFGLICDKGYELCHTCPNKNCINPKHIYTGTHKQNMEDAARAGVMSGPRRLSLEDIDKINRLLSEGRTQASIAREVGISKPWFTRFLKGDFKYAKPYTTSK